MRKRWQLCSGSLYNCWPVQRFNASNVVRCVMFIPAVCNKYKLENMKRFGREFIEFKMMEECFETAVELAKNFAE